MLKLTSRCHRTVGWSIHSASMSLRILYLWGGIGVGVGVSVSLAWNWEVKEWLTWAKYACSLIGCKISHIDVICYHAGESAHAQHETPPYEPYLNAYTIKVQLIYPCFLATELQRSLARHSRQVPLPAQYGDGANSVSTYGCRNVLSPHSRK